MDTCTSKSMAVLFVVTGAWTQRSRRVHGSTPEALRPPGGLAEAHAEGPVSEVYAEPAYTHRTFRSRKTTGTGKHQEST